MNHECYGQNWGCRSILEGGHTPMNWSSKIHRNTQSIVYRDYRESPIISTNLGKYMGYRYIMLFWDILGLMCWGCLKTSHQRVMHSEVRFCLRWGFDYIQQGVSANRVPIYHALTVAHMDLCEGSFADWNSRQEVECQTVTKDA